MPIKNAYICDECGKTGITDDEDQDPTGMVHISKDNKLIIHYRDANGEIKTEMFELDSKIVLCPSCLVKRISNWVNDINIDSKSVEVQDSSKREYNLSTRYVGRARIKCGTIVGQDFSFYKWEDDQIVFDVYFLCVEKHTGKPDKIKYNLVAEGYGKKGNYGSGALFVYDHDLIWEGIEYRIHAY